MMKQIRNTLILTSLLFVGCTAEEQLPGRENESFSVDDFTTPLVIGSASLEAEVALTRASTPTELAIFVDGYTYMFNEYVGIRPIRENMRYVYDFNNNVWKAEYTKDNIYLGAPTIQLCAYSPTVVPKHEYNNEERIPLSSQTYNVLKDLSYTPNQPVNRGDTVNLHFKHAYARLAIRFTRGSNYAGDWKVSKVKLRHLLSSTTMNITNGVYAANAGVENGGVEARKEVTIADGAGTKTTWGDFLLVPCTPYNGKTLVTVTVDGNEYTAEIPASAYTPKAGEYKEITLQISGKNISFGVTKQDWGTPDNQDIDVSV